MNRIGKIQILLIFSAGFWSCTSVNPVSASIIGTTGAINVISPPTSLLPGDLQSHTLINAFHEGQQELSEAVRVDISEAGTYASLRSLTLGSIGIDTWVDSYFLHADSRVAAKFDGSMTFDQEILGVILLKGKLDSSDPILGATGTAYPTAYRARGLEVLQGEDFVTLSTDRKTLTVHLSIHHFNDSEGSSINGIDQLRILTATSELSNSPPPTVPEPSSLAMSATVVVLAVGTRFVRIGRQRRGAAS